MESLLPTASGGIRAYTLSRCAGLDSVRKSHNDPYPGEAHTLKLHTSTRAPNPRRVDMFIAEKGISGIARELVDLNAGEHRSAVFTARNPMARVPVLESTTGAIWPNRARSAPISKACIRNRT